MLIRTLPVLFVLWTTSRTMDAAGVLSESYSYTKPVDGGKFLFVQLGDPDAEAKESDSAARQGFADLRARYRSSGLYPVDGTEPLWTIDGFGPYDSVFPASDGIHLVRIEGEWWRTRSFPGKRRLPADVEELQLNGPALSFFASGKKLKTYNLHELIQEPLQLPHTPEHILWPAGAALNTDSGKFVILTQDRQRLAYDYKTGELLTRETVGLASPIANRIMIACGVSVSIVFAIWAYFVLLRPRQRRGMQPQSA